MNGTGQRHDIWDPGAYLHIAGPRTRSVLDLLARIDHVSPRSVVDLGCGPGNSTELIVGHWPGAHVLGIDRSASMIDAASARARPGQLEFQQADLREWAPDQPVDVILSSASLQWIPGHRALLPRLAGHLAPGGVLGFQMPRNSPPGPVWSIMEDVLRASPAWRDLLAELTRGSPVHHPTDYLATLADEGLQAEAWETTYACPLDGVGGIVEYAKGSVLRPVLSRLSDEDAKRFLADYAARVRDAYPPRVIGGQTVQILPHRRVFAIGRKP